MNAIYKKIKELLIGGGPPVDRAGQHLAKLTDRELIKLESNIGRVLLGEIAQGDEREFFCLDKDTWVQFEQWRDQYGALKSQTIRYETHPKGILKVENDGKSYHFLKDQELAEFARLSSLYLKRVKAELYSQEAIALQVSAS